jgi:DNA polymerase-1
MVQFLFPEDDKAIVLKHPEDREQIQGYLESDYDFRAWNSKFDFAFLEAAGYTLPSQDRWHDGMVMAHVLDERRSVALQSRANAALPEDQARAHTEEDLKDWLKEETKRRRAESKENGTELIRPNYSDVPDEIMVPYAAHDVEVQRAICQLYEPKLDDDLKKVYELERGVLAALYDVEQLGINIDRPAAEAFERSLEGTLDRLHEEVATMVDDEDFNPASSAQLGEALKARGADLTFARTLKSGLPSTDKESLEAVDDDLARKVLELRSSEKLYSTSLYPLLHPVEDKTYGWRSPYIAEDGRIHANYRQVGARTARMSCSDPNMQNWHRDDLRMRHLVIPTEGNVFVSADLDSIELRLMAAFVGGGKMLQMMKDPDADMHTFTAKMVGLDDRDRGGGIIEPARQRGKKFNYERIYGGGVRAIRRWHGVSQSEAQDKLMRFHEAYPEVGEFQNRIEFALEDVGYVKTPWGRRHRCDNPHFASREAYKFVNYLIQGTAADIIKEALVRVHKAGIPVVAIVHDEILADVAPEDAAEAAVIIEEALIDHPQITEIIPLGAEAKTIERWSFAKDKGYVPDYLKEAA